jgi:hypothetical protein
VAFLGDGNEVADLGETHEPILTAVAFEGKLLADTTQDRPGRYFDFGGSRKTKTVLDFGAFRAKKLSRWRLKS